jgi:opacity protein-like surface antigen
MLGAGAAMAGGLEAPAPDPVVAVAPAADWTGFYAGAQLGYGKASADEIDFSVKGAHGGLHAGYLQDMGRWVAGAELEYSLANMDLEGGGGAEMDKIARLKVMAGLDQGDWLLYGLLGLAHLNIDVGGTDFSDTVPMAGLGAAYRVSPNWVLGSELIYHKTSDFDSTNIGGDMTTLGLKASFRF